jgi:(S)-ureidoglycine aminohydrolase
MTFPPPPAIPRVLPQGSTRSRITPNYALLTPDTFVPSPLIGWTNTRGIIQISPRMGSSGGGPQFLQYEAWLDPTSIGHAPPSNIQRFLFVLEGTLLLTLGTNKQTLPTGSYAYLPPGTSHELTTPPPATTARVLLIEKTYIPLLGQPAPSTPIIAHEKDVPSATFLGDDFLQLQLLLPDIPAFDMAVNIFTYTPGGTLPQVEIHIMEHGLLMLQGTGIYRLGNDWHPVHAGDVIWMAPYCEQWFCATAGPGPLRIPARYIYYKDINRHPGTTTTT